MREIKFRGKRRDNGEWVYGYYICIGTGENRHHIGEIVRWNFTELYKVIPETVGQFTGLKDKDGKEIYEGDVVEKTNPECQFQKSIIHCIVVWEDDRYMLKVCNVFLWEHYNVEKHENGTFLFFSWIHKDCYKIIGNTTDNPELLEEK